jgi:hypothetical protein
VVRQLFAKALKMHLYSSCLVRIGWGKGYSLSLPQLLTSPQTVLKKRIAQIKVLASLELR